MAYMKTRSRRIGEHVEHIKLFRPGLFLGTINLVVAPILLPALFDFAMVIFHIRYVIVISSIINGGIKQDDASVCFK